MLFSLPEFSSLIKRGLGEQRGVANCLKKENHQNVSLGNPHRRECAVTVHDQDTDKLLILVYLKKFKYIMYLLYSYSYSAPDR